MTFKTFILLRKLINKSVIDILYTKMWIADISVAVGPVIGYICQLHLIRTTKLVGSFSIDICAILMISAILRIYFWLESGYAISLLFQAMFIIIVQALLLNQVVQLSPRPKDNGMAESFWRWNSFDSYVKFLLIFVGLLSLITFFSRLLWIPYYGVFLGCVSMAMEATLGIPQLINNYNNKSVEGLSFFMIFTWFSGDFLKTLYFIIESQPFQFIMCGTIQLMIDILIIFQIINYKKIDKNLYLPQSQQIEPKNEIIIEEITVNK